MPQTKQHIRELLERAGVRPRHKWGQNFLIDLNLMRLLVEAAAVRAGDVVLEVGCGTGSLTELLAEKAAAVLAVDIDQTLQGVAREELRDFSNVTYISGDALQNKHTLNSELVTAWRASGDSDAPRKLVANLPYQIATPLLINLLELDPLPESMAVTVQAEVADRMVARPGGKDYGLISILLQLTGEVRLVRRIPPQAFWPAPAVHSAMVHWRLDPGKYSQVGSPAHLRAVVDLLLGRRRKTIRACLAQRKGLSDTAGLLEELGIDPLARGETLRPEQFLQLAQALK